MFNRGVWLGVEVTICLGPKAAEILFVASTLPFQFGLLMWSGTKAIAGLIIVLSVIAGAVAVLLTIRALYMRRMSNRSRWFALTGYALGVYPYLLMPLQDSGWRRPSHTSDLLFFVFYVMPLLCAAHLVFLARGMLFRRERSDLS